MTVETLLISRPASRFRDEVAEALGDATFTSCLSCATCSAGCPSSNLGPDVDPRRAVRLILLGFEEQVMSSRFVWSCTMCGRCTMHCPVGVNMATLVRALRSRHVREGKVPAGLQATVQASLDAGNNMSVEEQDYRETVEWIEEMLQSEVGDPAARIPLDKEGARVMYTLNPREVKYYPLTFLAAAKILHMAGEDWTLSSSHWDVTNYGLFSGDDEAARVIAGRLAGEASRLGVEELVVAECGHAYWAIKWGMQHWLGGVPFRIRSIVELMAEYIEEGRLILDPSVHKDPVAYHDPCNLCRKGGVVEEPRYVLAHAVQDLREMYPNREHNYCCGGGGGLLSATEYAPTRVSKGEPKAEQIRATGARIVATACHNCADQLAEINKHYKLQVTVKNVCELVADALVVPKVESEEATESLPGAGQGERA